MRLTLNGRHTAASARPGASLLDLLRDECGLRSMKDGCAPEGSCGACTVIVDGRAVVSCAQPAVRFEDREILTLEGLPDETRAAWAQAFVAAGASQCGFCSPGIVMKAEALLARNAEPSRDEVAKALAGNLCRCTGYIKIIDAIRGVAEARAGAAPAASASADEIGAPAPRYEGREQVLGERPFVADLRAPGMLHGAMRFSDHPRAVVRRIDTSAAERHPGVIRVVTWRDVPGDRFSWPHHARLAGVRRRGRDDALRRRRAGRRWLPTRATRRARPPQLIEVDYDVLEPISDPLAALAPDAPPLHPGGNLLSTSVVRRGDVDAALAAAAHVVSDTFTHTAHRARLPRAGGSARGPEGRRLRVYSQGQGAWEDRRQIAALLGLPETAVRVTQVATGGAFGGKEDLSVQAQAALLALDTGRPVLLRLTRPESLRFHPKRHPMTIEYTVGCDADGRLLRRPVRGSSATPARTPAWARRCSSEPPGMPAARTGSPTSTSRRAPSTRTTRRAARCAASASRR